MASPYLALLDSMLWRRGRVTSLTRGAGPALIGLVLGDATRVCYNAVATELTFGYQSSTELYSRPLNDKACSLEPPEMPASDFRDDAHIIRLL